MKKPITAHADAELIGIVIAGPPRTEVVPRVLAYVWGPAPEPTEDELEEPFVGPFAAPFERARAA